MTLPTMTFDEALEALGVRTHEQIAAKLGVARQAASHWAKHGKIPAQRVYQIRDIVEGRTLPADHGKRVA